MNIIPSGIKSFFNRATAPLRGKSNDMSQSTIVRAAMTLGPWDAMLHSFVPQMVNPYFYEALRKAMPLLDGGIDKLIVLDGLVRFEGKDQGLCDEIDAAMRELPVDDMETGLQSAYRLMGNEIYEQGLSIAECVMDSRGRKLNGVRTADSKGLLARRNELGNIEWYYRPPSWEISVHRNGTDYTEVVLRNNIVNITPGYLNQLNYAKLDDSLLVYNSYSPESNNPYGVSLLRSIEFVSQNLLRIQNATGRAWDRFGDPAFQLTYKTKNRALKQPDLDKRRNQLAADLSNTLAAKRNGNSADFVQAIGADDEVTINVIGGKGEVMEIQLPAQHMVEQILAKVPIPGWMIGLTEAQAGRMADQQSEMALMESKVRFERRLPALNTIVKRWLRGEGITWKDGAWTIVQELPNLRDVMKQAQARFLNAQADMMTQGRMGSMQSPPTGVTAAQGGDPNAAKGLRVATRLKKNGDVVTSLTFPCAHEYHKSAAGEDDGEPWAEDDAELPLIEAAAVQGLLDMWDQLEEETRDILRLAEFSEGGAAVWTFDAASMLQPLLDKQELFIAQAGAEGGPLLQQEFAAFVRGLQNAASEFDAEAAVDELRAQVADQLISRGLELVRDGAVRTYHDGIVEQLRAGAFDGINPERVSQQLADAFDLGDYNWTRLARSEIARAQGFGKVEEYKALGVDNVNFVTAGGACPICEELAAAGPYALDDAPQPVDDSHPNCRCTLLAVDPETVDGSSSE
jgi:SPP1 gp7 family putative phage head morphogenesis protein